MKMSIRIKFFIILIAFSLGPMLFSRTLMGREATQAAQEMASTTRQEMHQIIKLLGNRSTDQMHADN